MSPQVDTGACGRITRSAVCVTVLVVTLLARAALAATGPTGTLYLTNYGEFSGGTQSGLDLVQGNAINSFPTGNVVDTAIATNGDVRTFGYSSGDQGSRFNLAGAPLAGGPYINTIADSQFHDGTSDGAYNYSIEYITGAVMRFSLNWTSPSTIFSVTPATAGWITMNAADGSFWLSQYGGPDLVEHRSSTGNLLGSFNSGVVGSQGLALDPLDGTLWMSQGFTLYQFSQAGTPLQNITFNGVAGQWYGMEFDTTVPEPGLVLLSVTATAFLLRRKRNHCAG